MASVRRGVMGFLVAVGIGGASAALAEVATVSYRESAESFTWELRWDGQPPKSLQELSPPRSEGDKGEPWAPAVRLSRAPGGGGGARFACRSRHTARVHDLDAPQGPRYEGIFLLRLNVSGTSDWIRLDRRPLPHLSTPKDTLDTFDVYWKVETSAEGERIGRLIVQGAHGPAGRSKKPRKANSGTRRKKEANAQL